MCRTVIAMARRGAPGNVRKKDDALSVLAISPTRWEATAAFLFTVSCACSAPSRFHRLLVLTSLPFALPAYLLLQQGTLFLGGCTAALLLTSMVYHASHHPTIRAADVLLVMIVSVTGCVQAATAIATMVGRYAGGGDVSGAVGDAEFYSWRILPFTVGLTCAFGIHMINTLPCCYVAGRNMIKLQWHACLHFLTTAALISLAIGHGTCAICSPSTTAPDYPAAAPAHAPRMVINQTGLLAARSAV